MAIVYIHLYNNIYYNIGYNNNIFRYLDINTYIFVTEFGTCSISYYSATSRLLIKKLVLDVYEFIEKISRINLLEQIHFSNINSSVSVPTRKLTPSFKRILYGTTCAQYGLVAFVKNK